MRTFADKPWHGLGSVPRQKGKTTLQRQDARPLGYVQNMFKPRGFISFDPEKQCTFRAQSGQVLQWDRPRTRTSGARVRSTSALAGGRPTSAPAGPRVAPACSPRALGPAPRSLPSRPGLGAGGKWREAGKLGLGAHCKAPPVWVAFNRPTPVSASLCPASLRKLISHPYSCKSYA